VTVDALIERLAGIRSLSGPARRVAALTEDAQGPALRLARGEPLGHPAHPALTDLPIGFWTSATVLDLFGGAAAAPAARRLVGWGVLTTVPTIFSGLADVPGLPESKRRVAVLHAAANAIATAGFAGSWILRRRSRMSGILVGLGAGAIASAGGALGGWLAMGDAPDEQPPDERAEASDGAR